MRALIVAITLSLLTFAIPSAAADHGECEASSVDHHRGMYYMSYWCEGVDWIDSGYVSYEMNGQMQRSSVYTHGFGGGYLSVWVPEGASSCEITLYSMDYWYYGRGGRGHYAYPHAVTLDTSGTSFCEARNAAPTVEAGADAVALPLIEWTHSATYADPDAGDAHTATIDWGDGTSQPATAADGAVSAAHTYTALGTFTVTTCVTDRAGATGCDSMSILIDGTYKDLKNAAKDIKKDATAACQALDSEDKAACSDLAREANTESQDLKTDAKALLK